LAGNPESLEYINSLFALQLKLLQGVYQGLFGVTARNISRESLVGIVVVYLFECTLPVPHGFDLIAL
jgi:hypothetical protein